MDKGTREAPQWPRYDAETLRKLAAFLPRFEAPDFEFGRWTTPVSPEEGVMFLPGFNLSPVAADFVAACYATGWVQWPHFEWARWKDSTEARQLYFDPAALEAATPEQMSRLLTVLIRQDRFVENALGAAFDSGVLLRVLRRIATLAEHATGEQPPDAAGA